MNDLNIENEFGKFFYSPQYVKLKNHLFNYRFRKYIIKKNFLKYFKNKINSDNLLIVDIGSGISPVTPLPKKTLFVDLEEEAVKLLKKEGMGAITGDITSLPLEGDSVDVITCSEVLEHVKDYKKALKEMRRVLKAEGGAIITVPTHKYYWKDDDEFVGHYRRFNPMTLKKDIENVGLKIVLKKPIGSLLERNLTWFIVKMARKNKTDKIISKIKVGLFFIFNSFLLYLAKIACYFNSEKNSSVVLIFGIK